MPKLTGVIHTNRLRWGSYLNMRAASLGSASAGATEVANLIEYLVVLVIEFVAESIIVARLSNVVQRYQQSRLI